MDTYDPKDLFIGGSPEELTPPKVGTPVPKLPKVGETNLKLPSSGTEIDPNQAFVSQAADSETAAAFKAAARAVPGGLAGLAGAAAGAEGGVALGAFAGPYAPIASPVLGFIGGVGGAFGLSALTGKAVDWTIPRSQQELINAQVSPKSVGAGSFAGGMAGFKPNYQSMAGMLSGESAAFKEAAKNAANMYGFGSGTRFLEATSLPPEQGGVSGVGNILEASFFPKEDRAAGVHDLLMGALVKSNALGHAFESGGSKAIRSPIEWATRPKPELTAQTQTAQPQGAQQQPSQPGTQQALVAEARGAVDRQVVDPNAPIPIGADGIPVANPGQIAAQRPVDADADARRTAQEIRDGKMAFAESEGRIVKGLKEQGVLPGANTEAPSAKPSVEPGTAPAVSVGQDGAGAITHVPQHLPTHEGLSLEQLRTAHAAMDPAQAANSIIGLNAEAHRRMGIIKPEDAPFIEKVMQHTQNGLLDLAARDQKLALATAEGLSRMLGKQIAKSGESGSPYSENHVFEMQYRKGRIDDIVNHIRNGGSAPSPYNLADATTYVGNMKHIAAKDRAVEQTRNTPPTPEQAAAEANLNIGSVDVKFDTKKWKADPTIPAGGSVVMEQGRAPIVEYSGRLIVLRNINGVQVPFYLSTGEGGKKDVPSGKWYPFFGVSEGGWLNKKGGKEMASYHGREDLATVARQLDRTIGDIRHQAGRDLFPQIGNKESFVHINKGLQPTENGTPDTPARLEENIKNLFKRLDFGAITERNNRNPNNPHKEAPIIEREPSKRTRDEQQKLIKERDKKIAEILNRKLPQTVEEARALADEDFEAWTGENSAYNLQERAKTATSIDAQDDLLNAAQVAQARKKMGHTLNQTDGMQHITDAYFDRIGEIQKEVASRKASEGSAEPKPEQKPAASQEKPKPEQKPANRPKEYANPELQADKPDMVESFKQKIAKNIEHQKSKPGLYSEPSAETAAKNIASGAENSGDLIPSFKDDPQGHHEAMVALKKAAGLPEDYQFTSYGNYNSTKDFKARNDVRHWKPSEPIGAENPADVKERERLFREDAQRKPIKPLTKKEAAAKEKENKKALAESERRKKFGEDEAASFKKDNPDAPDEVVDAYRIIMSRENSSGEPESDDVRKAREIHDKYESETSDNIKKILAHEGVAGYEQTIYDENQVLQNGTRIKLKKGYVLDYGRGSGNEFYGSRSYDPDTNTISANNDNHAARYLSEIVKESDLPKIQSSRDVQWAIDDANNYENVINKTRKKADSLRGSKKKEDIEYVSKADAAINNAIESLKELRAKADAAKSEHEAKFGKFEPEINGDARKPKKAATAETESEGSQSKPRPERRYNGPSVSIEGLTFTKDKLEEHWSNEGKGDMYVIDLSDQIESKKGDIIQIAIKVKSDKGKFNQGHGPTEFEVEFREDTGTKRSDGSIMPMVHQTSDIVIPESLKTVKDVIAALRKGTLTEYGPNWDNPKKPGKMAKRFKAFLDLAESYQAKNEKQIETEQTAEKPRQLGAGQGELIDTSDTFNLTGENVSAQETKPTDTTAELTTAGTEPAYIAQARTQLAKLEKSGASPQQQETLRRTIADYEASQKAAKPEMGAEDKLKSEYRERVENDEVAKGILEHDYFTKTGGNREIRPTAEIAEAMNVGIKNVSRLMQQLVREKLLIATSGVKVRTANGSYTTTYYPADGVTNKQLRARLQEIAGEKPEAKPESPRGEIKGVKGIDRGIADQQKLLDESPNEATKQVRRVVMERLQFIRDAIKPKDTDNTRLETQRRKLKKLVDENVFRESMSSAMLFSEMPEVRDIVDRIKSYEAQGKTSAATAESVLKPFAENEPADVTAARNQLSRIIENMSRGEGWDAKKKAAQDTIEQFETEHTLLSGKPIEEGQMEIVSNDALNEFLAKFEPKDVGQDLHDAVSNELGRREYEKERSANQGSEAEPQKGDLLADIKAIIKETGGDIAIPTLPDSFEHQELLGLAQNIGRGNHMNLARSPKRFGKIDAERAKTDLTYKKNLKDAADGMLSDLAQALAERGWTQVDPSNVNTDVLMDLITRAARGEELIPQGGVGGVAKVDLTTPGEVKRLYSAERPEKAPELNLSQPSAEPQMEPAVDHPSIFEASTNNNDPMVLGKIQEVGNSISKDMTPAQKKRIMDAVNGSNIPLRTEEIRLVKMLKGLGSKEAMEDAFRFSKMENKQVNHDAIMAWKIKNGLNGDQLSSDTVDSFLERKLKQHAGEDLEKFKSYLRELGLGEHLNEGNPDDPFSKRDNEQRVWTHRDGGQIISDGKLFFAYDKNGKQVTYGGGRDGYQSMEWAMKAMSIEARTGMQSPTFEAGRKARQLDRRIEDVTEAMNNAVDSGDFSTASIKRRELDSLIKEQAQLYKDNMPIKHAFQAEVERVSKSINDISNWTEEKSLSKRDPEKDARKADELDRRKRQNVENRAGDPEERKGYSGIVARVTDELRLRGGISPKEVEGVTRIMNKIGSQFFEGAKMNIRRGKEGELGQYDAARKIVSIFADAIQSGKFEETAAHEIAHHLTRFLPEADRQAVIKEMRERRMDFLKENKGMEKLFEHDDLKDWSKKRFTAKEIADANLADPTKNIVKLTAEELKKEGYAKGESIYRLKLTDETYRLTNPDEYFAEQFKETVMRELNSDPVYLGRSKNWKEKLASVWETVKSTFRQLFGKDIAAKILKDFAKGRYNPDQEGSPHMEGLGSDHPQMSMGERKVKADPILTSENRPYSWERGEDGKFVPTDSENEPLYPVGEAFVRNGDGSTSVVNILGKNKMTPERAAQMKDFVKDSSVKHALYRGQSQAYEQLDANMSTDGLFHVAADPDYAAQYAYEDHNKALPSAGTTGAVVQVYINAKNIVDLSKLGHSIDSRAAISKMSKADSEAYMKRREEEFIAQVLKEVQRINEGKNLDLAELRNSLEDAFIEARGDELNKFQTSIWQVFSHHSIHSLFYEYGVHAIKYSDSDLRTAQGSKKGGKESYVLADPRRIKGAFGGNDVNTESSNIFQSKKSESQKREIKQPEFDIRSDSRDIRLQDQMGVKRKQKLTEAEYRKLTDEDMTFQAGEWERIERTIPDVGVSPEVATKRNPARDPFGHETVVEYVRKPTTGMVSPAAEVKAQESLPTPEQLSNPNGNISKMLRDTTEQQSDDADVFKAPRPGQSVTRTAWDIASFRYFSGISTKAHQNAERNEFSPAVKRIANIIHARPGTQSNAFERDMPTAIATARTKYHNRLNKIMEPLRDMLGGFKDTKEGSARDQREEVYKALTDMITGRKEITSGDIGKAAAGLKDLMAEMHEYRRASGEDIGRVEDYFPAVYDSPRIGENRTEFIKDAKTAYKIELSKLSPEEAARELGMTKKEYEMAMEEDPQSLEDSMDERAENKAKVLYDQHVRGASSEEFDSVFGGSDRSAGENQAMSRKFGREAQDVMRKWQVNDPFRVVGRYITSSAKRAELVRRFGNKGEKWSAFSHQMERDGVPYETISEMRDLVRKAAGIGIPPRGKAGQTYVDTITLMTAASAMGRGFINNLVEPVTIGMRTGSPIDILRAYGETWSRFLREIPAISSTLRKKMGETFWTEYGNEIGTIHNSIEDAWMSTHSMDLDAEYADPRFRWLTNRIYKANLMDASETAKQQAAHAIGFSYINKLSSMLRGDHWTSKLGLKAKQSVTDQLNELGIPQERHAEFAEWTKELADADDAKRMKMMTEDGEMAEFHREAMVRFSMQSSVRTNRAHKPVFQDDNLGKTVLQLMNFSYSYAAEVNSRMYNMSKQAFWKSPEGKDYGLYDRLRMMGPAAGGMLSILAYRGLLELKDLIYPSEASAQRAKDPEAVKWANATSYAGLLGPKFEQIMKAVKRDQAPGGPTGQMAVNAGRAAKNVFESLAEGKDMSGAQRSAAKAAIPVVKGAVVTGTSAINPILGGIATQVTNMPQVMDQMIPGKVKGSLTPDDFKPR